jgi:hypothetical protein
MKLTLDTVRAIAPVPQDRDHRFRRRLTWLWKCGLDVDELDLDQARQKAREILTVVRMGQAPAAGI